MFGAFFRKPASAEERRIKAWCRQTFGIKPRNLALYRQALRHRSALNGGDTVLEDNERLEFLGDAVLDAIVGEFLYHQYPDKGEGFLTRMRSKLVSRHQLSILAKHVGVERVMEVNINGSQDTSVPGNAMEALFGALLLDRGFDRTKAIVIRLITTHFDLKAVEQEDRDTKSRLLEWGQKQHRKVEFILSEDGSSGPRGKQFQALVRVDGNPCGTGSGHSKKKAEQEAARDAAKQLGIGHGGHDGPREEPPTRKARHQQGRRRGGRPQAARQGPGITGR
ncbi:MAG TPA: ribonuclease III [Flavobacteriales bacterium]|nr:ribonuclease III [Flavobacteriales bacterium]